MPAHRNTDEGGGDDLCPQPGIGGRSGVVPMSVDASLQRINNSLGENRAGLRVDGRIRMLTQCGSEDRARTFASDPIEQAYPLVFLCSDAAVGISGIVMVTDAGYAASGVTGSFAPARDVVGFLRSV